MRKVFDFPALQELVRAAPVIGRSPQNKEAGYRLGEAATAHQAAKPRIVLLNIEDRQLNEIRSHGERDYPFECCGLMLGRFENDARKVVVEIYPISNAREEEAKRNRFLIRPEELMHGEKYARSKGLDVVGFYHSHPDHFAVPSQYDLEHAWPTYSYIVVAVEKGSAADLRSWEMESNRSRFSEEEIVSEARV